ncbi:MAG: RHS repeat-associated core domain-containing protein [Methylococcaceae bacterium]|nr:RHS repeat-associated core domain-containing protein [Methylococcaceae bacterium]MDP2392732.1 RHS repeat-associated core domain-containing protein [Methylococcaceae bacterium]MDP3390418.1 RHS repeat-associated core domain-containing protein [Methylococcaceae bacterium]MDP3930732.1 RHS repeat-associated core domain-containing protein [Methylococcaceae bacterium]MDZ4157714.1 RHS repeat-associated core domain-containing protein [Methylococcales bacterium]
MAVVKSAPAPQQAQIYFIQADHLNAPRVMLNNANIPVWRWDAADAFGTTLPNEDPDGDGNQFEYNLRFPGQYYDQETGLHYNYFRDYDPSTGRYIQSDPIGLSGGLNTYGYVGGDPVNVVDPLGLSSESKKYYLPNSPYIPGSPANKYWAKKLTEACDRMFNSPHIDPKDVAGKTPSQIDKLANDLGLIPKGPDPQSGQGAYIDPETEEQRILCHPNCDDPHAHVNDPSGQRLDVNGNVVPPESPDAHLPIIK